ncbi:MAG: UDP-N-acetylmuramoyl-L-alanine--D-glutamate ligase, partial [Candidatus Uhrbacteria bacterium]
MKSFFQFTSYSFDPKAKRISFNYAVHLDHQKPLLFTETIDLPKAVSTSKMPKELLDNLLADLHLMLGISYYKLYCPNQIKLSRKLSKDQAEFWNTVYHKGLGEFCYRNKIDPQRLAKFPYHTNVRTKAFDLPRRDRFLVGVGGGKDSIVVLELLKENRFDQTAFVLETQQQSKTIDQVIKKVAVPALKIRRTLDSKIFGHYPDSYNGHIPISAVIAWISLFSAVLYDYKYIIVGNEQSSNVGNLRYKGQEINHQWSKSQEFESLFQEYTSRYLTPSVKYFSLLRPFYEIRIVEMFVKYKKYWPLFTSCNQYYKIFKPRSDRPWCGQCPKCAFVFLLFAAFLPKQQLIKLFGQNLLNDKDLVSTYRDLLGFGKLKPFDCVGTFEESQVALYLASRRFKSDLIVKEFLSKIKQPEKLVDRVMQTGPAPTLPTRFKFFGIKNVLLLGYAKEGQAVSRFIKKKFPTLKVGIADKNNDPYYLEKQADYDLVIKTPGISKEQVYRPYTTGTNMFFSQISNQTIGITGTKGKSTTTSLIYAILKEAGKPVRLLGNIGNPMLGYLLGRVDPKDILVIEFSSYQLDDIEFSPNIAVALNLFSDHLDYHGSIEQYYQAKQNIVKYQNESDLFIYNPKQPRFVTWAKQARSESISFLKGKTPVRASEFPSSLIGQHNQENIQAAITVARQFGIKDAVIKRALKKFKPLPHRLELVGEFKDIRFYDDAISTTPESTIAAIKSLQKVDTIFLGGQDRGYDFS